MDIGKNIKYYRQNLNLTQKELANKSGLSEISIRKYENNDRKPKYENLKKIAIALNISPTDIDPSFVVEPFKSPFKENDVVDLIKSNLGDDAKKIPSSDLYNLYNELFTVFKESLKPAIISQILKKTINKTTSNNIDIDLNEDILNELTNFFIANNLNENNLTFKFDPSSNKLYMDFKIDNK